MSSNKKMSSDISAGDKEPSHLLII